MKPPFLLRVRFESALSVRRGKLLKGAKAGVPVHAATFVRRNLVILDSSLRERPRELGRIWLHELFHFVWWRMGNLKRLSWERTLDAESAQCVPGELGWSAESRKAALCSAAVRHRARAWREYCCESFCDTGAWLLANARRHPEWTLPRPARLVRERWFAQALRYNPK